MFENIKLKFHIGTTVGAARNAKHVVIDLRELFIKKFGEEGAEIDAGIKTGDIDTIKKAALDEIRDNFKAQLLIDKLKKDEFLIEHRILAHLREIAERLERAAPKVPDLMPELDSISLLLRTIIARLRKQKLKARDLRRDHQKLRDMNLIPIDFIFRIMRIASRKERWEVRTEVSKEQLILDLLENTIKLIEHGKKVEKKEVLEIKKVLKEYIKDELPEEVKHIMKIEDELIVLSFRLEHMNKKEIEKLHALLQQGFPQEIINEVDVEEKKFLHELEESAKKDYRYARSLYSESKRVGRVAGKVKPEKELVPV